MWRYALAFLLALAAAPGADAQAPAEAMPQVRAGTIERLENFPSKYVEARHVDVWLPPGYSAKRRYAVLYMQDGRSLFDPALSSNQQSWQVDAVAAPLLAAGRLRDFIVVGPWNNPTYRSAEYYPQKFLPHVQPEAVRDEFVQRVLRGQPRADAYLRFLVEELKPAIDRRYSTLQDRNSTFVMGASAGALVSLYALMEYPQVFGGAAALSTPWIYSRDRNTAMPDAALAYLREKLPAPGAHRIYMDRGTAGLDALYDDSQARVDALLRERGFTSPTFVSRVFEGEGHNETAWHRRLEEPLVFLLGK